MDHFEITDDQAIDLCWAQTYVGMQMSVPDCWWEGCNGQKNYPGTIDKYNPSTGKWMLQLDDSNYHKTYPMKWGAVWRFVDNNSYTFLFLPTPWPLSADFDDTISGIEEITEEMISKFHLNKDKLQNNSRQQSGFQAFSTILRNMDVLEKTEYIFLNNGAAIINSAMWLQTHEHWW